MMSIFIAIGAYRYYAALAERFGKTKWHFGLLAVGVYLGFQVFFLFSYGFYQAFSNPNFEDENNYSGFSIINLASWLLSIVAVYGLYKILESKFRKENIKKPIYEIDQIGRKDEV